MRNSKKALLSVLIWLLFVCLISAVLIIPYLSKKANYYGDSSIKGKLNTVFCGSSQCQAAFIPKIINEQLGVNSYNIAVTRNAANGRKALIQSESKQNKIETVIIDISIDTLMQDGTDPEGNIHVIESLHETREKLNFAVENLPFDKVEYLYRSFLFNGFIQLSQDIFSLKNTIKAGYGFNPQPSVDITLSNEDIASAYNSTVINENDISKEELKNIDSLLAYCSKEFTRTIVVATPVSDSRIWEYDGFDAVLAELKKLTEKYSIEYYDFNLSKNRYVLYSDAYSFKDECHLSKEGAEAFSKDFCNTIKNGADFYSSYQELKQDSPYMAIYQAK